MQNRRCYFFSFTVGTGLSFPVGLNEVGAGGREPGSVDFKFPSIAGLPLGGINPLGTIGFMVRLQIKELSKLFS